MIRLLGALLALLLVGSAHGYASLLSGNYCWKQLQIGTYMMGQQATWVMMRKTERNL